MFSRRYIFKLGLYIFHCYVTLPEGISKAEFCGIFQYPNGFCVSEKSRVPKKSVGFLSEMDVFGTLTHIQMFETTIEVMKSFNSVVPPVNESSKTKSVHVFYENVGVFLENWIK